MNIYYVYMYLRTDGTPYYVGKGKERRAYEKHVSVPVPRDKSRILFPHTNLSETDALCLEVEMIALYGRKNNGTGILRNLTDGGEGISGYRHTDETRRIISEYMSANHPRGMAGKHHNAEQCAIWSAVRSGKGNPNWGKDTPQHVKDATSKANKGMVVCRVIGTGDIIRITKDEYRSMRGVLYEGVTTGKTSNKPKGMVAVLDLRHMTCLTVTSEEFHSNRDRYIGVASKRARELLGRT